MADQESARTAEKSVDRLIYFSDAVIAIAITLLALQLPVPAGNTAQQMWHSVGEHQSDYFSFLISFAIIAIRWSGHHSLWRYVLRVDGWVKWWNLIWLFAIILTPFAQKVLAANQRELVRTSFIFYAGVQLLAGLAGLWSCGTCSASTC